MAQWTDEHGVFHNTDNLAYGDQGDTRYWEGTPGTPGSVTYDRPKDEPGAQPTHVVVDSGAPGDPPVAVPVGGGAPVLITGRGFVLAGDAVQTDTEPGPQQPVITPSVPSLPQVVLTCTGYMALDTLTAQLQAAGYAGPWDADSMLAAYNRAACSGAGQQVSQPSGSTSGGTGGNMGFSSAGTSTALTAAKTATTPSSMDKLQAWVQKNPLPAVGIAAVAGSVLLGKRRW